MDHTSVMTSHRRRGPLGPHFGLAQAALTIVVTVASTLLTLGGYFGAQNSRLSTAEAAIERHALERKASIDELKRIFVPRAEHEAHWQFEVQRFDDLKRDMVEQRRLMNELLGRRR